MSDDPASLLQGEAAIIQEFLAPLAVGYPGAFGLTDDCAAFTPAVGCDLVVKTDPVAAGVHFLPDDPPADIAWKALAVNVSDLVAKAATPRVYLMALSFPETPTRGWMRDFSDGLRQAQQAFGLHLIGGDTDRRPGPLTVSITVLGEVPTGRMVRRGTARAGDEICVSGSLGDAALGLALRNGALIAADVGLDVSAARRLVERYLRPSPEPRLIAYVGRCARAAMDISDGLVKDLGRMCAASGVGADIALDRLPISMPAAAVFRSRPELLVPMITAGDDYEILASVDPNHSPSLTSDAPRPFTVVGHFTLEPGIRLRDRSGHIVRVERAGWDHF